jgi:hypothetical protein
MFLATLLYRMEFRLRNKILSTNLPALVSFQNRYTGEPISFLPLSLRDLLIKARGDSFFEMLDLLCNSFPLSKDTKDEALTEKMLQNIFLGQNESVFEMLRDPSWTIRILPQELRLLAEFCYEQKIPVTFPPLAEISGRLASIINECYSRD